MGYEKDLDSYTVSDGYCNSDQKIYKAFLFIHRIIESGTSKNLLYEDPFFGNQAINLQDWPG
jgi:hypothetical protein